MPEPTTPPAAEPSLTKAEAMAQVMALPDSCEVALSAEAIVAKLDAAARRGKLAGFAACKPGSGELFVADAFGTPFEGVLVGMAQPAGTGTRLVFARRLKPVWPWGFGIVLVLSVWPGVELTESVLAAMFPGATWLWQTTYYWYLPLAIVGGIFGWIGAIKKSRLTVAVSSHETADKVKALLGVTPPPQA
ncbi:MAG: hypothetical protein MUE97_01420 [Phycisphaerales bacterium]|nr:hypothetical protein [Phycisphaerales bacterium]